MEVRLEAHQVIEKTVKSSGNSGRVYVPKEWIGKRVKVLLLDSLDEGNKLSRDLNEEHLGVRMAEEIDS